MYLKRKFHTYQVKWCYLMLCQLMHCHQQAPEYQLFATLSLPGSTMHILSVGFHETNIIFIWHHSINRSIYKKMSVDLVFHPVLLFAPISHFPVYTSPNVLFSMYDMFTSFSFIVQTLRICCDTGECIFSVVHPSYENGVITLSLCVIVLW